MADFRIFDGVTPAGSVFSPTGGGVTLGMEIYVDATSWLTRLWAWRANNAMTSVPMALYTISSGTVLPGTSTTVVMPAAGSGGSAWYSTALAAPVRLTAGTRYRVAMFTTSRLLVTDTYWSGSGGGASGRVSGILRAPSKANAQGQLQGAVNETDNAMTFPNGATGGTGASANFWVDATVSTVNPAQLRSGMACLFG